MYVRHKTNLNMKKNHAFWWLKDGYAKNIL